MHESSQTLADLPCLLFSPESLAGSSESIPLIVFLHGSSESGSSLERVKDTGLPRVAEDSLPMVAEDQFPFLIVAPQAEKAKKPSLTWKPHTDAGRIVELVDELVMGHRADPRRCYLTGISVGAYAVWENAARFPDRFAALMPVSGGVPPEAKATKDIPAWLFAGGQDKNDWVCKTAAQFMPLYRQRSGFTRLSVDPTFGHDQSFWNQLYARQDLYEWLLSPQRGSTQG